jgi:radical SAM superfamily enzyme YgiQ (UPF0313 family)
LNAHSWEQPPRGRAVALISLYDFENNAVRQLAAGLRREGVRVVEVYFKDWQNNRLEEPAPYELDALVDLLRREDVGLAGISVRASAYQDVSLRVGSVVRGRAGIPLVFGGWHVTVRPEAMMDGADALCLGEADESFPAFVKAVLRGDRDAVLSTHGFWVRDGSEVRKNPSAPLVAQLDSVAWRDYTSDDKWIIDRKAPYRGDPMDKDPMFQVLCSIGCIQKCSFCHNSFDTGQAGARLRFRSVSSVLDELAARRKLNPSICRVRFDDEIFGLSLPWLREFAERYPKEVGLPFDLLTEPTVVSEQYADLLQKAGARYVHLGIQSTEEVNRESLERRANRDTTRAAVERLTARGMQIRYLTMVDIEGVTEAQKAELFEWFQTVPEPYDLYLFSLTHFPGSKMVEDAVREGRLHPSQVEGEARKTFSQYRVDLRYPRENADTRWIALYVLQSSGVLPRRAVAALARSGIGRKDATPIVWAAHAATLLKTARVAGRMAREGELTPTLVRRWWNPQTMITM